MLKIFGPKFKWNFKYQNILLYIWRLTFDISTKQIGIYHPVDFILVIITRNHSYPFGILYSVYPTKT